MSYLSTDWEINIIPRTHQLDERSRCKICEVRSDFTICFTYGLQCRWRFRLGRRNVFVKSRRFNFERDVLYKDDDVDDINYDDGNVVQYMDDFWFKLYSARLLSNIYLLWFSRSDVKRCPVVNKRRKRKAVSDGNPASKKGNSSENSFFAKTNISLKWEVNVSIPCFRWSVFERKKLYYWSLPLLLRTSVHLDPGKIFKFWGKMKAPGSGSFGPRLSSVSCACVGKLMRILNVWQTASMSVCVLLTSFLSFNNYTTLLFTFLHHQLGLSLMYTRCGWQLQGRAIPSRITSFYWQFFGSRLRPGYEIWDTSYFRQQCWCPSPSPFAPQFLGIISTELRSSAGNKYFWRAITSEYSFLNSYWLDDLFWKTINH